MVSYAQNAEDVVLRRVFADVESGFYVDVGACVPVEDSVTLHFYEQGWGGVNIEPDPRFFGELAAARVRDVNLNVAIGAAEDVVTFYPTGTRGQGTLDARVAAARTDGSPVEVTQVPLRRVLSEHSPSGGVDFLKVDVEGWEAEVLASADWSDVRPRVVVVEAVDTEGRPTYDEWEPPLLAAGYRYALFDGLNRFYCRLEDADRLLPHLAAPANVLDNWRPAREVQVQASLQAKLAETETTFASQRAALEAELAAHAEALTSVRAALEAERAAHADSQASARAAVDAEQAAHAETRRVLDVVLTSTSWRATAPLRNLSRRAKTLVRLRGVTTIRRHGDEIVYPAAGQTAPSEGDDVFEVTGVPAHEILRRSTALRAARTTAGRKD